MPLRPCQCRQLPPIPNLVAIPRLYLPKLISYSTLPSPPRDVRSEVELRCDLDSCGTPPRVVMLASADLGIWGFWGCLLRVGEEVMGETTGGDLRGG